LMAQNNGGMVKTDPWGSMEKWTCFCKWCELQHCWSWMWLWH
jgi:hypothetical protein